MWWVLGCLVVWILLASVAAPLLGRGIRRADEEEDRNA